MDAYTAVPAGLVLIGVHPTTGTGADATGLLLGLHPAAPVVIVGSVTDVELLAVAYTRGVQGLLFWDPDLGHP